MVVERDSNNQFLAFAVVEQEPNETSAGWF